jgi:hypothetical protein
MNLVFVAQEKNIKIVVDHYNNNSEIRPKKINATDINTIFFDLII